jgi:hypothetical protein
VKRAALGGRRRSVAHGQDPGELRHLRVQRGEQLCELIAVSRMHLLEQQRCCLRNLGALVLEQPRHLRRARERHRQGWLRRCAARKCQQRLLAHAPAVGPEGSEQPPQRLCLRLRRQRPEQRCSRRS